MLAAALLAFGLIQAPVQDSARVLQEAQAVLIDLYSGSGRHHFDAPCRGLELADCMDGEWSCPGYSCPRDLADRRPRVMRRLDELAMRAGNSEWLTRQRVALAIKQGDLDRAMAVAIGCRAVEWWCLTLRGLVMHLQHPGAGFEQFDQAFRVLERSPRRLENGEYAWGLGPDARCIWSDIQVVAAPEISAMGTGRTCEEASALIEQFWWLADPLWSDNQNERYMEHLARHVMIRMDLDIARILQSKMPDPAGSGGIWQRTDLYSTYAFAYRQGFPNSRRRLEREIQRGGVRSLGVAGSAAYVDGGYSFAPSPTAIRDPLSTTAEDWLVVEQAAGCAEPWTQPAQWAAKTETPKEWLGQLERMDVCGSERMITREQWFNLEHQVVVLRRGKELEVVSAAQLPPELVISERPTASLVLGEVVDRSVRVEPMVVDSSGVLRTSVVVPDEDYLASIEARAGRNVGRARFGLPPRAAPDMFSISDVALVNPDFEPGSDRLETYLLPTLNIPAGTDVVIYFEAYGLQEQEDVQLALTVTRSGTTLIKRIGQLLGLSAPDSPLRVEWQSGRDGESPIMTLAFRFDSARQSPGEYLISITAERAGNEVREAHRTVTIR